jgi:hypothetical protein
LCVQWEGVCGKELSGGVGEGRSVAVCVLGRRV